MHIGQTNPAFSDPPLEAVDVRQIYDKFPEKKGGLKELYEKGPPNAFFLVKFWVSCPGPSLLPRVPSDVRCTQAYPTDRHSPGLWALCGLCPQPQGGTPPWASRSTLGRPAPSSRPTSTAPSRRALAPSMGSAPSTARPTA